MPHQCTNCGRVFADGSKEMLSGCPDCGGNKFQFRPESSTDDVERDTGESDGSGGPERSLSDRVSDAGAAVRDAMSDRSRDADASTARNGERDGPTTTADPTTSETGDVEASTAGDATPTSASTDAADASTAGTDSDDDIVVADDSYGEDESTPDTPAGSSDDGPEDRAQATARSDVVTPDEIEAAGGTTKSRPESDGRVIEPTERDRPSLDELREELNDQFESIKVINPGQYELNLMELYDRNEYIISLQEDGRYVIEVPDAWRDDD